MQTKSSLHLMLLLSFFVGNCLGSGLVAEYFVINPPGSGCNATDVPALDQIIKTAIRSNVGPNVGFYDEFVANGGHDRSRSLVSDNITSTSGVPKCTVSYCNANPSACLIMGCTLDFPTGGGNRALRGPSSGESVRRMQVKEEDQRGFSSMVTKLLDSAETSNTACDTSTLKFIFRYKK